MRKSITILLSLLLLLLNLGCDKERVIDPDREEGELIQFESSQSVSTKVTVVDELMRQAIFSWEDREDKILAFMEYQNQLSDPSLYTSASTSDDGLTTLFRHGGLRWQGVGEHKFCAVYSSVFKTSFNQQAYNNPTAIPINMPNSYTQINKTSTHLKGGTILYAQKESSVTETSSYDEAVNLAFKSPFVLMKVHLIQEKIDGSNASDLNLYPVDLIVTTSSGKALTAGSGSTLDITSGTISAQNLSNSISVAVRTATNEYIETQIPKIINAQNHAEAECFPIYFYMLPGDYSDTDRLTITLRYRIGTSSIIEEASAFVNNALLNGGNVYDLHMLLREGSNGVDPVSEFRQISYRRVLHSSGKVLKDAPFPVGAAIQRNNSWLNTETRGVEWLKSDFNSVTFENHMKMSQIWKGRHNYDFAEADKLVAFAKANNLRIHGHTLIWSAAASGYATSPWLPSYSLAPGETWTTLLQEYITTVVGRYKDEKLANGQKAVVSWDVVNEALAGTGTVSLITSGTTGFWYEKFQKPVSEGGTGNGKDFIRVAFETVRDVDPDCIRFYNDIGFLYWSNSAQPRADIIQEWIDDGIPIQGIGMQFHSKTLKNGSPEEKDFMAGAMASVAAVKYTEDGVQKGVYVHVSELDIKVNTYLAIGDKLTSFIAGDPANAAAETAQALAYRTAVEQYILNVPAEQRFGITMWGLGDKYSSARKNPDFPLIFDDYYNPKMAYYSFIDGFLPYIQ